MDQLKCKICKQAYTEYKVPRLIPLCGHTFCQECLIQLIRQQKNQMYIKCPDCDCKTKILQQKTSLQSFPKNISLHRIVQLFLIRLQAKQRRQLSLNQSNIVKGQNLNDDDYIDFFSTINQTGFEQLIVTRKQKQIHFLSMEEICVQHHKKLEIVCMQHMIKICSNCALFGQHKNHQVKTIEDVVIDITNMAQITLNLYTKIQVQWDQKNFKEKYKQDRIKQIYKNLNIKKSELISTVKMEFRKIMQKLENEEQKQLTKIQEILENNYQTFIKLLNQPEQLNSEIKEWSIVATDIIQNITAKHLKIELLLQFMKTMDKNIVQNGNKIYTQSLKYYQGLLFKMESQIEDFKLVTNIDNVFNHLQNFIEIKYTEFLKPKPKSKSEISMTPVRNNQRRSTIGTISQDKEKVLEIIQSDINQEFLLESGRQSKIKIKEKKEVLRNLEKKLSSFKKDSIREEVKVKKEQTKEFENKQQEKSVNISDQNEGVNPLNQKHKEHKSKKKKKIELNQKFNIIYNNLVNDKTQEIDFTNANLGDQVILQICQSLKNNTRCKKLKLIGNKLTDQVLYNLMKLVFQSNVISLNLSQNFLSDRAVDILYNCILSGKGSLMNLTLSQNKINKRNMNVKLQKIKNIGISISL